MSEWELESPGKGEPSQVPEPPKPILQPEASKPRLSVSGRGPAPRGRRRRFSYLWLVVVLVALLVGVMAGFFLSRSQTAGDEAALAAATTRVNELQSALTRSEDRNWTYYRNYQNLEKELEQATSSTSSTSPTTPESTLNQSTYSDGVYLVGEDIRAGTYEGTVTTGVGYWARLKGTDGAIGSIIENRIVTGPFVLTINPADKAVELSGVTLTRR